jgi:hypothetical protein
MKINNIKQNKKISKNINTNFIKSGYSFLTNVIYVIEYDLVTLHSIGCACVMIIPMTDLAVHTKHASIKC